MCAPARVYVRAFTYASLSMRDVYVHARVNRRIFVSVRVCACVRNRTVCVRAFACVHVCVRAHARVCLCACVLREYTTAAVQTTFLPTSYIHLGFRCCTVLFPPFEGSYQVHLCRNASDRCIRSNIGSNQNRCGSTSARNERRRRRKQKRLR